MDKLIIVVVPFIIGYRLRKVSIKRILDKIRGLKVKW